jgi:hypothetical protein
MALDLTEMDDLRLFIEERVKAYDSSIDTTVGSSFDAAVIQPLLDRLGPDPYNTPIRDFILSRLRTEFPDLVLQDGEPLDDLVVKPNQVLLSAFRRQIQQISLNQSFANPDTLNEREADNLGANFFVRRRTGGYAIGIARLYFSAPQYAYITPSNAVFTGDGLRFYPVETQGILADRMLFNLESNLYFFDIVVKAESEGSDYNIASNTLVGIENFPSVVKVTNKSSFEEGADKEETSDYLERIENSLTEKSLVTLRGIRARLLDDFDSVRLIQAIGFGDPEMKRDIIKGSSQSSPYAYFRADVTSGSLYVDLVSSTPPAVSILGVDGSGYSSFSSAGISVGDTVELPDVLSGTYVQRVVEEVVTGTRIRVNEDPGFSATDIVGTIKSPVGGITLSDIPGGIIQPTTMAGEVEIKDGEVHIGGAVDVFIRAGDPSVRSISLEGIRDGNPLRFGVDLESFGDVSEHRVQVTEKITSGAAVPTNDRLGNVLSTLNEVVIKLADGSATAWYPSEDDVGRYIQLLGSDWGTLEISSFLGEEYFGGSRCARIRVDTSVDHERGGVGTLTSTGGAFTLSYRLLESVSPKSRVRDRDGSTFAVAADSPNLGDLAIPSGVNFISVGASVGDSVVVETGDDAGIYTIRRVLSWLNNNDTLILDRAMTRTLETSGIFLGSGLRYRVDDELNLDLVAPKVVKIPLGSIFSGDDLSSVAGDTTVTATASTNFLLAGVETGDTLEILEGDNSGTYSVVTVYGTQVVLDRSVQNTAFAQTFSVYKAFAGVDRPLVRVKSIELLDSNSQPTGISIPYGDTVDARIVGKLSNRAEGTVVESYTGAIQANLVDLVDLVTDFEAEGVLPGHRLNILDGPSSGSYTIQAVGLDGGLPSNSYIRVEPVSSGGTEFKAVESPIHYSVGLASSGYARLYFTEPTSVEIRTGLSGGRLRYGTGTESKDLRFSDVSGYRILPARGSEDSNPRDLKTVKTYSIGGGQYHSIVELTDPSLDSVFGLEILENDVLDIYEELEFRDSSGQSFSTLGIFGKPAGLRTLSGSNRVHVPPNSKIDFLAMNNVLYGGPLEGQTLIIDSGPDAGEYIIEEVIDSKTLRISASMTTTTESYYGDSGTIRDATMSASGPYTKITDLTDWTQFGTQIGHFLTLFESLRGDIDGTYEITDIITADKAAVVDTSIASPAYVFPDVLSSGQFSWVRTSLDSVVEQPFRIYKAVPKQFVVHAVATKRAEVVGVRRGSVTATNTLQDALSSFVMGASRGDLLEVLAGPNRGVYFLSADSSGRTATIYSSTPFPVTGDDMPYRIWGGIHGSTRMLTLKSDGTHSGKLDPSYRCPFVVKRPSVYRISSTEMQDNFDGSLYYLEIEVESDGSGDSWNLEADSRMSVVSGVSVDGYTYSVDNENLAFSPYEGVSLVFDRRFLPVGNSDLPENTTEISGRNLQVNYEVSSIVRVINDMLRSDLDRPINASPLARHFLPSFILATFQYAGGVSTEEVGADLEDYINGLGALTPLEVSDLEAFLIRRGANSITHPIEIVSVTHDLSRKLVADRSQNVLGGLNEVPYNGTGRISAFFAKVGEGLTLIRG